MSVPREGESLGGPRAKPDYRIDPETGCWNWLKSPTPTGYPWGFAHRRYFRRANPDIETRGMHVHHVCRNTLCVNPDHLVLLTQHEHIALHRLEERGHTLDTVREIRAIGRKRGVSAREVAKQFGVSHWTIYYMWTGQSWAALLDDPGRVVPEDGVCRECNGPITGRRDKKFCCARCRGNHNSREGKRRKRALVAGGR